MNASMSAGFRANHIGLRIGFGRASDAGDCFERLQAADAMSVDRISAIRAQIQRGTYDTPERLDAAIDCMLSRIALE